ncbi:MAG: synthase subunit [Sphingomonadales bacterium]|nr:synthase subunit [Sphingomonadales bacterium]
MSETVTVATTGVPEVHHEESAYGLSAPAWVALSMLIVIGLMVWKKVPALIGAMLDKKIVAIRQQLDEATKLRAEAEALLATAKAQSAASAGDAAAIIAHAQAEAKILLSEAEAHAVELTARRTKMAEDKIGAAERSAVAEVRAKAASAAASVAAQVIAQTHDAAADRGLIDSAISRLN